METNTVVVKTCLASAIRNDLLPYQRETLLEFIDTSTELISRLQRRASLIFLHYITTKLESGQQIPDFSKVKDSYWHNILRYGIDESIPDADVSEDNNAGITDDLALKAAFNQIKHIVGTTLWGIKPPIFFSRVLGHAAIGFKTSIINNLHVPFMEKLKRLCKAMSKGNKTVDKMKLLHAIRSDAPDPSWPEDIQTFISDVRTQLGIAPTEVIFNAEQFSVPTLFKFSWWMQQKFDALGLHKNMIAPVFKVSRSHIRIDATTLSMLTHHCMRPDLEKPPCRPSKKSCPNLTPKELKRAQDEYKARESEFEKEKDEYSKKMAEYSLEYPSYNTIGKSKTIQPDKLVTTRHPMPPTTLPKKRPDSIPDEKWDKLRKLRAAEVKGVQDLRSEFRKTDEFLKAEQDYSLYEAKVHASSCVLFEPFNHKSAKAGWVPSYSICTDGVSLSVTYERSETAKPQNSKKTSKKKDTENVLPPHDNYDPHASTIVGDTLVIGIDPGRITIVYAVCVGTRGNVKIWKLTRGEYYTAAGVFSENRAQNRRYKTMEEEFQKLNGTSAALRATRSSQIQEYLEWNATVDELWWSLALKRSQSRSKLARYIGKRSVMSRFFAQMHQEAKAFMDLENQTRAVPITKISVAYGSAAMSMPSTGKGETSVPVKGAFGACVREFGQSVASYEDEYNSTKVSWMTGLVKEKAYKMYVPKSAEEMKKNPGVDYKEILKHTCAKYMPVVPDNEIEFFTHVRDRVKTIAKRRKSGSDLHVPLGGDAIPKIDEETRKLRYIECRGLRFCTETCKFYDRDRESARAIAGLRCIGLMGLGRPSAFCHSIPALKKNVGRKSDATCPRRTQWGAVHLE
jgi:hypothetical protein